MGWSHNTPTCSQKQKHPRHSYSRKSCGNSHPDIQTTYKHSHRCLVTFSRYPLHDGYPKHAMYPSVMSYDIYVPKPMFSAGNLALADFAVIGRTEIYRAQGTLTTFQCACVLQESADNYSPGIVNRNLQGAIYNFAFFWCRNVHGMSAGERVNILTAKTFVSLNHRISQVTDEFLLIAQVYSMLIAQVYSSRVGTQKGPKWFIYSLQPNSNECNATKWS